MAKKNSLSIEPAEPTEVEVPADLTEPAAEDAAADLAATDDADHADPKVSEDTSATLIAVTMVNLGGRYYEPGTVLPPDAVAAAGEAVIAALLEAGAIGQS